MMVGLSANDAGSQIISLDTIPEQLGMSNRVCPILGATMVDERNAALGLSRNEF
jgi:hypothetical protein